MPKFTPKTRSQGTYTHHTHPSSTTSSIYDDLGGTYDKIAWSYDGRRHGYINKDRSIGAFTPKS